VSGWTIPGYTELKTLGAGGFGAVVLARHDATGTPVAIKFLRPHLLADPDFAAMFRAEAVTLGAVDSPYVVRLYEYVEAPAGAAIVMELVDGVSLHDMVTRHGKTTPEAALLVLYGSLLGLAAAHQRGVVHRDFKPANVLVNARGASKLTDFGIAARTGSTTIPAGSLSYAPPEQFDGGPATPASDVYAATATFYECLTGHPPFRGNTHDELLAEHRTAPVPLDQVPEALRPIVTAGMAKDPGQRPADAAVLAAELRTAAAGGYGADWAERGRSHLGEAAVLLAALWPTGGAPSAHGFTSEQLQLSRGHQAAASQHVHGQQAAHGAQHNLHLWHVLHREHVAHLRHLRWLRTAMATAAGCAVAAAVATVAVTGHAPSGPGTSGHPAVVAYQAPPFASVAATLAGNAGPGNATYAFYPPGQGQGARVSGTVTGATSEEAVMLYAQQFPYTSPPALVEASGLNLAGSTGTYSFTVYPTVATRYQVRLLQHLGAPAPLAVSRTSTVYVTNFDSYGAFNDTCTPQLVCTQTWDVTISFPPSALPTELVKKIYVYYASAATSAPAPGTLTRAPDATVSAPRQITANVYQVTVSLTVRQQVGQVDDVAFCTKQDAAQDGIGLPGPSACGSASLPASALYLWGGSVEG
jgi:hypothetical protein